MGVILRLRERKADRIALLHDRTSEADEWKDGVVGTVRRMSGKMVLWGRGKKERLIGIALQRKRMRNKCGKNAERWRFNLSFRV